MYDLLIKNSSTGDIAIKDGLITKIAPKIDTPARQAIDASGLVVSPGFIDIHRHADAAVFRPGFGTAELAQGVTTIINGNCGLSIAPLSAAWREDILRYLRPVIGTLPESIRFESFSEYLAEVEKLPLSLSFGMNIGNGAMRMAASGFEMDPDIPRIHQYLEDALEAGAFGVSLGLIYMPECKYDVDGLVKALAPISGTGVPLVTHVRGEGDLLIPSLEEVIAVARRLDTPLHISHLKAVGKRNWGEIEKALKLLDDARASGLRVTCDVYPWTAGCTQLAQVLPPQYLEGGLKKTTERLKDPEQRKRCRDILESPQSSFENQIHLIGWENIMVGGKFITETARERGIDPYECAFDILVEEGCNVSMVNFIACEEDIEMIIRYPHSFIASDSIYQEGGLAHPRRFGTFAKVLESKILPLEQALWKFTTGPAQAFNIPNKGQLAVGYDADIVIFDPKSVRNAADYTAPETMPEGIEYVFAHGKVLRRA